ncbi:MAG: hypothetical protein PHG16_00410 [Lachnospiraceae bacterium]|nr:hypothetical protein [Lachnospiraceae bacterium]
MKKDMNRMLIETAVRRALKDIPDSPERTVRNLVDLGLNFSKGRFLTKFLSSAQEMLHNEKSAYYSLVKNTITGVDQETLMTFGINLGYNGCTKGAKTIRAIEEQRDINIPWSLTLILNTEPTAESKFYPSILEQGIALGIHTYFLFVPDDTSEVLSLLQSQPECAFIIFLHGHQLSDSFIEQMKFIKNGMICIYADDDMISTCKKLQDAKLLYAVYQRYTEQDRERILTNQWLLEVLPAKPIFAFLVADPSCSAQIQQEIYSYILSVRERQEQPVIFMDMKQDSLMIDEVISKDVCMVGFNSDGSLRTHQGIRNEPELNIFHNTLDDILQRTMKK